MTDKVMKENKSFEFTYSAKQQQEFEGKVLVVDNGRVSTPMHRSILDALELPKMNIPILRGSQTCFLSEDFCKIGMTWVCQNSCDFRDGII